MPSFAIRAAMLAGLGLVLTSTPVLAKVRTPPKGSYQASCSGIALSNSGVLTAECEDSSGRSVPARLRMPDCGQGDIVNRNGQLICPPLFTPKPKVKPPATPMTVPAAGPTTSAWVTLYSDIEFKGRKVELKIDSGNLDQVQLNDVVSSIQVHGGQWQICSDAAFKGHCVTVTRDSPNLTRFGLNDKVSSIRRTE